MRIGILSRNRSLYSTRRLAQAIREQGHEALIIDTMLVSVESGGERGHIKVVQPGVTMPGW
jgi:ribosomal protein S6--L-glutamate ligase